jgi:short-subunit dehydrogenase
LRDLILSIKVIYYTPKINLKNNFIRNKKILITGANSGIGLELTKILLKNNNKVIAIFNKNSHNLNKLYNKNLIKIKCDLSLFSNLELIKKKLINLSPQIIINNAAYFDSNLKIDEYKAKDFFYNLYRGYNINSFAVLKLIFIFLDIIKKKKISLILNISSDAGIISKNKSTGGIIYKSSKTSLNAITKCLSMDLKSYDINIFSFHPGPIKTKSNPDGLIAPKVCALKIAELINENNRKFQGKCVNWNEKVIQN